MRVKMHSIMAGPDGCSDAGREIDVSEDAARRLISGGYAAPVSGQSVSTAAMDARSIEAAEREASRRAAEAEQREAAAKSESSVKAALGQLDAGDDDHWTAGGKPAMDAIKELTGSATITRAELDAMFPAFRRPDPADATAQETAPAAEGSDAAGAAEPAAPARSGARSNRP